VNYQPQHLPLPITLHAPDLQVASYTVDDFQGGNGNGVADPGETVDLWINLANAGGAAAEGVVGVLSSIDPNLQVDPTPRDFGDVPADSVVTAGPFGITVSADTPVGYSASLTLDLTGGHGLQTQDTFSLTIGTIFADDMEAGPGGWTHYNGTPGYDDQWHLETYRNHTSGGETSWKCGGPGPADYGNFLHSVLESPTFQLPPHSILSFWQWIDAETLNLTQAWDGGNVEISTDGGNTWELITPEGGYPYTIVDNPDSPFPAGTPVFSGSRDWEEQVFDLSAYEGFVKIRFVFGTDGLVTMEGWYVDDIVVMRNPASVGEGEDGFVLRLQPAGPIPARGVVRLRIQLGTEGEADLGIFDVTGRRIATLVHGPMRAGNHQIVWNGRDDRGQAVGSGVYWARLSSGGRWDVLRIIRVR
jgi:hypothetical protein